MKKICLFMILLIVFSMLFCAVCFAEDTVEADAPESDATETEEGGTLGDGMTVAEREQLIRDVINTVLDEGDENLAGQEWWDVLAAWVRAHLGEIVAAIGGVFALIGFCVLNPKVRSYVNVLGTACKNWFGEISLRTEKLLMKFTKIDTVIAALQRRVDALIESNMLLVTALEDVIKLSGADEGKKEIYIKSIEAAKETVKKVNETEEVKAGEPDEV